ncbi:LuxR C-terminal-related transcriptional regulator [Thermosyntropha lipolytica]|uniref:response regulator transcription factor n=1 Tax=Thermosyntropha lipolytica TaxID=54294 RepID=UPI001FA8E2E9|nr:response regulator transcription factor [Thermosyntropha lipolytica]
MRVVIADDTSGVREKLKKLLGSDPGIELLPEAGDGQGAINMARKMKPEVVIMDANMPGTDGMWATRVILRELPETRVIGLAVLEDEAEEMLKAGACVCLFKNVLDEGIVDIVHKVVKEAREKDGEDEMAKSRPAVKLTRREKDVLAFVAQGKNNRQIAEALDISEKTVKNHLTSIFRKLGVRDRTQAALYALKNGLV